MPAHSAARLQALFASILELPEQEREAFLQASCAEDPDMLLELRQLLAMDEQLAGRTIRPLAPELTQLLATTAPAEPLRGSRVGAFELGEELGRGGMGSVYRAQRVDGTVAQQVAIKFVRRELLDAGTLRRFQLERQTLAMLDHPNIARLIDAAELADGTPYFVMEYVAGVPVTEHCMRHHPGIRERIALIRTICAAVAHAHRNLVVHRDLKPGNILVTDAGIPKLLDFGIAKALSADIDAMTPDQTGTSHRYFSPNYSAPEQLLGGPIGVGCDVYALGLLMYELIAGVRPFDFTGMSSGQIERLVTTIPPVAPSVAAQRGQLSIAQQRQLRGDIDGIVLRCLRKSPSERYASVEQLDADLGNYLEGRPVQARGGHRWYRAQKFVRRNLVAVAASTITAVTLVVGIVGFAWQARVANHQAGIAEQRAAELEQVAKFQADMLGQVDATQAGKLLTDSVTSKLEKSLADSGLSTQQRGTQIAAFSDLWRRVNAADTSRDLIVSTILEPAAKTIEEQFGDQPLVNARLSHALARRYFEMGLNDAALMLEDRALSIRRDAFGDEHADTAAAIWLKSAILMNQGRIEEADKLFQHALDLHIKLMGKDHADTLSLINNLGYVRNHQGRLEESAALYREALEGRRRVLGNDNADTIRSINNVGMSLQQLGKFSEAEPYFREALQNSRRALGEDAQQTLVSIGNMGFFLQADGRRSEAEPYFREALEKRKRILGAENLITLNAVTNLAGLLRNQRKLAEAEMHALEAVDVGRRVHGDEHSFTLNAIGVLASTLRDAGRLTEAEPLAREVDEAGRRVLGEDHPVTLGFIGNMGRLLQFQGRYADALPYLIEALEKHQRVLGAEHPATLKWIICLGALRVAQGEHAEALAVLSPAEAAIRSTFDGASAEFLMQFLTQRAIAQIGLAKFTAAEADLLQAQEITSREIDVDPVAVRDSTLAMVDLYLAWHRAEPGKGYHAKAIEWQQKLQEFVAGIPPEVTLWPEISPTSLPE
jgi:eukaryotic-like serine/threonine-protein kinase